MAAVLGPPGEVLFAGDAWVGGRLRATECRDHSRGYWLRAGGGTPCVVANGGLDLVTWQERSADADATEATLTGPALILALAVRGTFCLHASAVDEKALGAVAFVGPSGQGKSTMAALLAADGWRPIADDTLPVSTRGAAASVWPHFPQPAGPPGLADLPERVPLWALYVLEPVGGEARCSSESLCAKDAALVLAGHTVAARLFKPDLLAQHLDFCVTLAERVGVRRLIYPRRLDVAPQVAQVLRHDLALRDV